MSKLNLIETFENRLFRLVDQVKDLKECREELSSNEFSLIKDEIVEQSQEFSQHINRLQIDDLLLNKKIIELKLSLRKAIGSIFSHQEIMTVFGPQDEKLLQQLLKLEEDYKMKLIDDSAFTSKQMDLLVKLQDQETIDKSSIETVPSSNETVSDIFSHTANGT